MGLEGVPPDDLVLVEERRNWLRFHRLWGQLPEPAQLDLARSLHLLKVAPGRLIYREGQPSLGLYLLKWGTVEVNRLSPIGQSLIRQRNAGELFGYVLTTCLADLAAHRV